MGNFKAYSAPFEVFMSVTNRCNLSCKHCSVSSSPSALDEGLSVRQWLDVIDQIEDFKVFTVRISGGEPFAYPGIFKIIDRLSNGLLRFSINTNAMLVGKEEADRLKRYRGRIDNIMVSLDGSRADIHDRLRGRGSYKAVFKGIDALLDNGLPVSLYTTVVRYNYLDIPDILRLAKKFGVENIKFNELLPIGNASKNFEKLELSRDERILVIDTIKDLKSRYNGFLQGTYCDLIEMFSDMDKAALTSVIPSLNICSAGNTQIMIRHDGWVTPCDRLYDYKIENILNKSLKEIWNGGGKLKRFRKRFDMTIDDLAGCRACVYKYKCEGGCPAIPFALGRGLSSKDPLSCYRVFNGEEEYRPYAEN